MHGVASMPWRRMCSSVFDYHLLFKHKAYPLHINRTCRAHKRARELHMHTMIRKPFNTVHVVIGQVISVECSVNDDVMVGLYI